MEVASWASFLSRVATYGFVVVAPEQTQVSSAHMNAALDYVIGLSQDSSSAYYNKVDTSKLGSTGYSLGGSGAMRVAANARIGATFIWDSGGSCSALGGPLGIIVAEGRGLDLIDDCPPLSFGMEAAGTTHTSLLSFPGSGMRAYAQEGLIAWFRWHFLGDPGAEALFAGASCGFCTRAGMTVKKNGFQ